MPWRTGAFGMLIEGTHSSRAWLIVCLEALISCLFTHRTHSPQMVRVCDPSFGKHHQAIVDKAVGGGIVCGLGEKSLRDFLTDISINLKPQQDFIVQALEELRRSTEVAVAALEESGSPFKHTVIRNLRTHHAAYVTFTKVGGVWYNLILTPGYMLGHSPQTFVWQLNAPAHNTCSSLLFVDSRYCLAVLLRYSRVRK